MGVDVNDRAGAMSYCESSIDDEDMLAYLYPLNSPLDRPYGCDTFTEHGNPHSFRESRDGLNPREGSVLLLAANEENLSLGKAPAVAPDPAKAVSFDLDMGNSKAHGTILQNSINKKGELSLQQMHNSRSSCDFLSNSIPCSAITASASMLPPKYQSITPSQLPPAADISIAMNFPYFSRPAALAKASLQTHLHHQFPNNVFVEGGSMGAFFGEPSSTGGKLNPSSTIAGDEDQPSNYLVCSDAHPNSGTQQTDLNHSSVPPSSLDTECADSDIATDKIQGAGCENHRLQQGVSRSMGGVLCDEIKISSHSAPAIMQAMEPSSSTCSGDSENNSGKCITTTIMDGKRKKGESGNIADSRSDVDVDKDSQELKKTARGRNSKRGRAAEVHNLSERRRRDRINEKMRALQELIPNSNKTDKASMLDEAIEYLKTLQSQLQMMSMRSGITVPPAIVPSEKQPFQLPPIVHVPNLRVGVGLGMGVGMMEMTNNGPSLHVLPLHLPQTFDNFNAMPASFSDLVSCSGVLDSRNSMMNYQQLQPFNMDFYQASLLHQQQQQQQQQQQAQVQPFQFYRTQQYPNI